MDEIRRTRALGVTDAEARRDYGRDVCPDWLAPMLDNPLRRWVTGSRKMVESHVRPGMTVLDVGCGSGALLPDLARIVGSEGSVICADIQAGMLERVARKSVRLGVANRVRLHQCSQRGLGLEPAVADFAIAYWMLHEAPDPKALLAEIRASLKPDGKLLVAEPGVHVNQAMFERTLAEAGEVGLRLLEQPSIRMSRVAVFGVA